MEVDKRQKSEVSLGFVDDLEVKVDLKTPVNSESKQNKLEVIIDG